MTDETEYVQFKLRMPTELKSMLDRAADQAGRSLSSEIINRLHRSFSNVDSLMVRNRMAELKLARQEMFVLEQQSAQLMDRLDTAKGREAERLTQEAAFVVSEIGRLRSIERTLSDAIHKLTGWQDTP